MIWETSHLYKKAFVFPEESDNSYVSLKAQLKKPLKAFTVCLYIYSELAVSRGYSVFSYAIKKEPNEILIFWSKCRGYTLAVHETEVLFKSPENTQAPTHMPAGSPSPGLQSSGWMGSPWWGRVWRRVPLWGQRQASSWVRSRMHLLGTMIKTSVQCETLEMWTCETLCCLQMRLTLSMLLGPSVLTSWTVRRWSMKHMVRCSSSLSCGPEAMPWSWRCFLSITPCSSGPSPPPIHILQACPVNTGFCFPALPSSTPEMEFKCLAREIVSYIGKLCLAGSGLQVLCVLLFFFFFKLERF